MESTKTPVHPLVRAIAIALLISIFLGILPIVTRMLGFNFLPSPKWMSAMNVIGLASGLVFAAASLWFGWKSKIRLPGGTFKKSVAIVAGVLFGFFVGQYAVLIAPPMILAIVAGDHVETSFTVARANASGSSHCRSPIQLQGLPFLFNKVCRVGSEVRKAVSPGSEVKAIGHGTDLGLFAQDISPAS